MSAPARAVLLIGRILFASLFAFSARGHIQNHSRYVGIAQDKLPVAFLAGWPTGLFLLLADVSIVAGIWPDVGNVTLLGAALSLFALFAGEGHVPFALTGPALSLR